MKKISILTTLLLAFMSNFVIAQIDDYAVSAIPETLKKDAHTVIRYEKTTFEVSSLNKGEIRYKGIITLMDKKSPYSDVVVFYDKAFDKVELFHIKIYDANGKMVKKIKNKAVSDHSSYSNDTFNDGRYKYADATYAEYPYTVEYEYKKTRTMTMFYPDWYINRDFEISVEQSEFEIITPKSIQVRHKAKNIEISPKSKSENGMNYYQFSVRNIPAFLEEPVSPIEDNILPHVFFAPNKFGVANYEGDMSSWEKLGTFSYELNEGRDELSDDMRNTINKLIVDAETKEDKIKILYRYLQENMRYVSIQLGVGGWQTFDAKYVERNKYGDCKALTNFMKSMLTEIGIESHAALLRSGDDAYDQTAGFSTADFNHVVLYVPNESKNGTWLECTSSDFPAGVIGSSNEDRFALLVKKEGSQLIRTPTSTKDDNSLISNIKINISKDGTAQIKANQRATGHQDMTYRYYALNESEDNIKRVLQNSFSLPSFKIKDYALSPSKDIPETDIMLDLEVPKYASKGGKRLFISPNPINQLTYIPREVKTRKLPIENRYAFSDVDVVTIEIPDGYEVESIPEENLTIENDFGKYAIKFEQKENQLIYTRTMERKLFSFPKERYTDYRDFLKAISKADRMKVVLVRNQP
ncbi:MAG: hypothetical protein ACJA1N_001922 [Saprospiraceae bacterium]|jgi:hypothetical protein